MYVTSNKKINMNNSFKNNGKLLSQKLITYIDYNKLSSSKKLTSRNNSKKIINSLNKNKNHIKHIYLNKNSTNNKNNPKNHFINYNYDFNIHKQRDIVNKILHLIYFWINLEIYQLFLIIILN